MTDPREPMERLDPVPGTPRLGGPDAEQHNAADDFETAEKDAAEGDDQVGDDANDLDADNPVEEDTLETVDPDNAPA